MHVNTSFYFKTDKTIHNKISLHEAAEIVSNCASITQRVVYKFVHIMNILNSKYLL